MNRKIIIIGIVVIATIAIILGYFSFTNQREAAKLKENILSQNDSFIRTWGTYDYKDFEQYPARVLPLVSEDLYYEFFSDEQSLALREGKLISKEYSIKTEPKKNINFQKEGDNFVVTTEVEEKISSKEEAKTSSKRIKTSINNTNNFFQIIDVEYITE